MEEIQKLDYIPTKWLYTDFVKFNEEYFEGNIGIYNSFTKRQREMIEVYMRWKTRRMVEGALGNSLKFSILEGKTVKLAEITGGDGEWVYDGCIDSGEKGNAHCTLGHSIRYKHIALNTNSGEEVIFGIKCASDFFNINPKILAKLNKSQRDVLEEIKFVAFIHQSGRFAQYKTIYRDLSDIVSKVGSDLVAEKMGKELSKFIASFIVRGIPLTEIMVGAIIRLKRELEREEKRLEKLKENEKNIQDENFIWFKSVEHFLIQADYLEKKPFAEHILIEMRKDEQNVTTYTKYSLDKIKNIVSNGTMGVVSTIANREIRAEVVRTLSIEEIKIRNIYDGEKVKLEGEIGTNVFKVNLEKAEELLRKVFKGNTEKEKWINIIETLRIIMNGTKEDCKKVDELGVIDQAIQEISRNELRDIITEAMKIEQEKNTNPDELEEILDFFRVIEILKRTKENREEDKWIDICIDMAKKTNDIEKLSWKQIRVLKRMYKKAQEKIERGEAAV